MHFSSWLPHKFISLQSVVSRPLSFVQAPLGAIQAAPAPASFWFPNLRHQQPPIWDYCTLGIPWRRPPRLGSGDRSGSRRRRRRWDSNGGSHQAAAVNCRTRVVLVSQWIGIPPGRELWLGRHLRLQSLHIFYIKLSHFLTYVRTGQCNWYAN